MLHHSALHVNTPFSKLQSLVLILPLTELNVNPEAALQRDGGYLTPEATVQCLLTSLHGFSTALNLTEIEIHIYTRSMHGLPGTAVDDSTIWQSHFLKPLSPDVQALWAAIDTTLSTTGAFPVLKQIDVSMTLEIIDWLSPEDIEQAELALEGPDFDFEPLESYVDCFVAPGRDRRRVAELTLRADSELLPLASKRVKVGYYEQVIMDPWPLFD